MKRAIVAAAITVAVVACGRRVERAWFDAPAPKNPPPPAVQPLPESAFEVLWAPVEFPREVETGQWTAAQVTFTNVSNLPWPDRQTADPGGGGAMAVRLGYSWTRGRNDRPQRSGHRSDLDRPLAPRESATLPISVRAPDKPGDYLLHFELVQENAVWFADRGADVLTVPVRVRASAATADPPKRP